MAKLYWTKDIKKILHSKIHDRMEMVIADDDMDRDSALDELMFIKELHSFVNDVISGMEEDDRRDDEETERILAMRKEMIEDAERRPVDNSR